jgi:hypothetical protein
MDEHGISKEEKQFKFIVSAQLGMSTKVMRLVGNNIGAYELRDPARFGIQFFLHQVGLDDATIERYDNAGRQIFEQLPIDLRYYKNFAYNDKYVKKI